MNEQHNAFSLLRRRRFLPLFATQFLGATNDSLFKQALFILIAFELADRAGLDGALTIVVAGGLFILPFFLFSATAGQIADKFEKSSLIRRIKLAEIAIMALAAMGFVVDNAYFLIGVLFLMGTQSAFFGPVKYSILPDHLGTDELLGGNAFVEAGTFLAILLGTIAGGLLIRGDYGISIVATSVVVIALLGYVASRSIPRAGPADPALRLNPNILAETWHTIGEGRQRRDVFLSILGISWFWLFGANVLTQLSPFTKDYLHGDEQVVTLFTALFTVGIGAGSLLCNRLLRGEVSARFVPLGAIAMALFTLDLCIATTGVRPRETTMGALTFLQQPGSWRIIADMTLIAVSGGVFTVPLYTIMQSRSDPSRRSRVIAANNILNALFMVIGAAASAAMLAASLTIPDIFLVMAIVTGFVAVLVCGLLPDELVKVLAAGLMRLLYRVEVRGLENYRAAGDRAVILANHVSFLDGALLAAFLPGKPTFAVNTHIARKWWARPFLGLVDFVALDPTNPMATKTLVQAVRSGKRCVIFPEGRITVTGALMKVYEGPAMIADKADAPILPIRIEGAQYTPFSRVRRKVRTHIFPKITMTVLEPREFAAPAAANARERRRMAGLALHDVMADLIFSSSDTERTLFEALADARALHGRKAIAVEDIERQPLTYNALMTRSLVLGRRLGKLCAGEDYVGVMLPNATAAAATFFALQAAQKTPALLNFSVGSQSMRAACAAAGLKTVLTSRRFVEMAKLAQTIESIGDSVRVVYLEDLRKTITSTDKLYGVLTARVPGLARRPRTPDAPAVVLFTSGSEGTPKGVVLSHRNILSNIHQLGARVDFNPTDIVFNALPIFHSFGLTGGMLLPVLSGIKSFLYPSPLHYRIVPELVYDTNATILFGTDTFLTGYARMANAYDFYSIRYVFAGAEKVREETRNIWASKFGLRILEGYGATETAPVIATNTPMHYRPGSVGRFLPGLRYRIEPVPGIEKGGRLFVAGPNVMLGYLRAENPGVIEPLADGWHDMGDIVEIDDSGFVTIAGRAKRFAKIGGEMVSLSAAESQASDLWPDHQHAVVSIPDDRKGEQLVLVTDRPDADRDALFAHAKSKGIAELMVPKAVVVTESVPLLATGKVDYPAVQALAEGAANSDSARPIGAVASE